MTNANRYPCSTRRAALHNSLHAVLLTCCMALFLQGCATTYPANPPLQEFVPGAGYEFRNLRKESGKSNEVMVLLAFSGGGTRAAAFSYGVLKELHGIEVSDAGQTFRLSDEVDAISGVSGGSFTAAYFGLFRDRIFEDYERVFLRRDVQGELTRQVMFNPVNWGRLLSPTFTRADLATQLYDETIFEHATFGDMQESGGPFVVINATEMTLGTRFQFTQNYFNPICSDLSDYPVARAVTASSAVPILFSPVTLTNRAGECGWQQPAWVAEALDQPERTSRLYNLAANISVLEDREKRPYLHLFDGGLADNLGLRAMLDGVLRFNGITQALQALDMEQTRKVVVILVNAETALDVDSSQRLQTPTFAASVNAATSVPLSRYSFETVALMKNRLEEWERQSYEADCGSGIHSTDSDCKGVDFHFIEVNFSEHPDPAERDYLKRLPTSFVLTNEAVDRLIAAGGLILRNNREFQRLMSGAEVTVTDRQGDMPTGR